MARKKKVTNMFKPSKSKTNFSRPEGAGNYDNMDDFNIVQTISTRQGTVQHTPTNDKDIVNKEYVDTEVSALDLQSVTDAGATTTNDVNFLGNVELPNTESSTTGIITKEGVLFLHNYRNPDSVSGTLRGQNTFLGERAGNTTMGSTASNVWESSFNTGIGEEALSFLTTGYSNSVLGSGALNRLTTGYRNVAIGETAGRNISTGSYNTSGSRSFFLGFDSRPLGNGQTNQIVIGESTRGLGSNTVVLGNDNIVTTALKGNVGIGTGSPAANLEIGDGTGSPTLRLNKTGAGVSEIQFYNGANAKGFIRNNAQETFELGSSTAQNFYFYTSDIVRMVLHATGNVGIGSDTIPSEKLQVDGNMHLLTDSQNILLGTGKDAQINYDGTDMNIKTNNTAPSDLVIDCGTEKTVELTETVWDDFVVPVSSIRFSGIQPPIDQSYKGGYVLNFPDNLDRTAYFTIQLPHKYKEGTDVKLHVHWAIPTAGSGSGAENVEWEATYSASSPTSDNSETFPTPSSNFNIQDVQNLSTDSHIVTDIATMNGTNYKISECIICSLTRDVSTANNYTDDAYVVSVDVHYEVDTMGSRQEFIK